MYIIKWDSPYPKLVINTVTTVKIINSFPSSPLTDSMSFFFLSFITYKSLTMFWFCKKFETPEHNTTQQESLEGVAEDNGLLLVPV